MKKPIILLFTIFGLYMLGSCIDERKTKAKDETKNAGTQKTQFLTDWGEKPRERISSWVEKVTDSSSPDFIPVKDRIAVFDNDGTLWPEQPWPNQLQFALDYLKARKDENSEWQKDPLLKKISEGDMTALKGAGVPEVFKIVNATHTGITEKEFNDAVREWLDTAKNKKFDRRFEELVYSPMLQLMSYLREHEFKTFIVSGGGADFVRVFSEDVYGIPPYQVIGSYGEVEFEINDGEPVIKKVEGDIYFDDEEAKPRAIHRFIGKRPVFIAGNGDGDQAMMEYATASNYNTLCILLYHTDAEREYAYDKKTLSGHMETALEKAKEKDWLVVNVKEDFKTIFPD